MTWSSRTNFLIRWVDLDLTSELSRVILDRDFPLEPTLSIGLDSLKARRSLSTLTYQAYLLQDIADSVETRSPTNTNSITNNSEDIKMALKRNAPLLLAATVGELLTFPD